jgi:acetylglutamate kinase
MKAGELIADLTAGDLEAQMADGTITGGMKAKARSILKALSSGVKSVHLIDGRVPHSIIGELFTDHGVGSLITSAAGAPAPVNFSARPAPGVPQ